jgi:hypothetical protein
MDEKALVEMDAKLDTYKGTLTINLLEVLEQLDEEQKQELISDGGWWSLITKDMAEKIVDEFSRENYAPEYTALRKIILNSESMPSVIREWAISVYESLKGAQEDRDYWSNAYWNLYRFIKDKLNYDIIPPLPIQDRYNGKEYSKEMMKKVEEKIKEWKDLFPDVETDEE